MEAFFTLVLSGMGLLYVLAGVWSSYAKTQNDEARERELARRNAPKSWTK